MDLKEVHLLGDEQETHWYYAAKRSALLACLDGGPPRRILDVGAGNGFFARTLLRQPGIERATCVDPGYTDDRLEIVDGKPLEFRREMDGTDADLVLLMDVLEHVDDDVGLLKPLVDAAEPGTRFVVSVPAFSWLWSDHDNFLEHRRRYTLGALRRLLSSAGTVPVAGFYLFGLVFPAAAAWRLWRRLPLAQRKPASDLRRHHPWVNALLRVACLGEVRVTRFNRMFGLTAFVVADKPRVPALPNRMLP